MSAMKFAFTGQYNTTSASAYSDFKSLLSSEGFQGSMWFIDALPPSSPNEWVFDAYAVDYRFPRIYILNLSDPTASAHSIKPSSFSTDFPNAISMGIDFEGPDFV